MSARMLPPADDARQREADIVEFTLDGAPERALAGQSIAGAILATGRSSWRTTRAQQPRGVFCGIGVCFDCLVEVNGARDVRACLRRVCAGDAVRTQSDAASVDAAPEAGA